jgi:hypothetical protein
MDMQAHRLPDPEGSTTIDAHRELAAIASWARALGFTNVYYRINWALRALMADSRKGRSGRCR